MDAHQGYCRNANCPKSAMKEGLLPPWGGSGRGAGVGRKKKAEDTEKSEIQTSLLASEGNRAEAHRREGHIGVPAWWGQEV